MSDHSLAARVRRIIASHAGRDAAVISDADTMQELRLSNVAVVEIGLDIEDAVGATATDEEIIACDTVGAFVALAEKLAGETSSAASTKLEGAALARVFA